MFSNLMSLHLFVPEIALTTGIVLLLVWDMVFSLNRGTAAFIALVVLFSALAGTVYGALF